MNPRDKLPDEIRLALQALHDQVNAAKEDAETSLSLTADLEKRLGRIESLGDRLDSNTGASSSRVEEAHQVLREVVQELAAMAKHITQSERKAFTWAVLAHNFGGAIGLALLAVEEANSRSQYQLSSKIHRQLAELYGAAKESLTRASNAKDISELTKAMDLYFEAHKRFDSLIASVLHP